MERPKDDRVSTKSLRRVMRNRRPFGSPEKFEKDLLAAVRSDTRASAEAGAYDYLPEEERQGAFMEDWIEAMEEASGLTAALKEAGLPSLEDMIAPPQPSDPPDPR